MSAPVSDTVEVCPECGDPLGDVSEKSPFYFTVAGGIVALFGIAWLAVLAGPVALGLGAVSYKRGSSWGGVIAALGAVEFLMGLYLAYQVQMGYMAVVVV